MNEELKALLEELQISEETAAALGDMIAEAIKSAVDAKEEELNEAHAAEVDLLKEYANGYGEHIRESIIGKVKGYANYAVEEFIKENSEKFVQTEQFERQSAVLEQIKDVFESHGFSLNENRALDEANAEKAELSKSYETTLDALNEARASLEAADRQIFLLESTKDLTVSESEKAKELLEAVTFNSLDEYKKGVELIVEQVSKVEVVTPVEVLNEEVIVDTTKPAKPDTTAARWAEQFVR